VEKRQAITQTIREHFEQQVDFLQRLVQAKSANPFTLQEIKSLIKKQLARVSINHFRLDDLVVVPPAETDPRAEIVQTLPAAVEAVTGTHPKREGSGPACDGWMFITRGIPTVCGYGVTHGGVHGADAWADLESLCNTTDVYAHTILHFLGEKLS